MSMKLESCSSSSSTTGVKSEPPSWQDSVPSSSATSMTSFSDITLGSAGYDSTSSTPRRNASRSSAKRKRNTDYRNDSSVYIVSDILARSFEKSLGPNRQMENQYLVRWEGYGPKDDTWEYRSNLMGGASAVVKEFESRPLPFTILDSQRWKNTTRYLVRYGKPFPVEPSPMYATEWQTEKEMHLIGELETEDIDQAVRDYREGNLPGNADVPRSPKKQKAVQPTKGRRILEILDRKDWKKPKHGKGHSTRYLIRWKEGKQVKEDWLSYWGISDRFGVVEGRQWLKEWNEEMGNGAQYKKPRMTESSTPLSEYEIERRQNMEANKELMRSLGL
ncbi:hypothetical protein L486_00351 [Kwoniella mangroviensis CBS 10435]|uniref:Chromo domain-containing protein n=1 Tax=Kwoniella mangroviensis CBS 10435 TaxID=1331196 RepID=A0A1B9IYW7_9TREE|nr:hypothetical protein L486_00351 [Kwoniella mangroviensis CBS 10435]